MGSSNNTIGDDGRRARIVSGNQGPNGAESDRGSRKHRSGQLHRHQRHRFIGANNVGSLSSRRPTRSAERRRARGMSYRATTAWCDDPSRGNLVQGNYLGPTPAVPAIPNGYGVEMIGGTSTIGGSAAGTRQRHLGQQQRRRSRDVQCRWHDDPGQPGRHESDRHLVQPQRCERISINDVSNTTVGAGGAGAENTIAFNALHGVVVGRRRHCDEQHHPREPNPHEWPTGDRSRCRRCRDRERCGGCGHRSEQPPELPRSDVSERRFRPGNSPVRRTGSMSSSFSRTPRVTAPATVRQPVSSSPSQ